jgi:replicative superfamily II helicase
MTRSLVLGSIVLVLAACGESGEKAVAHVGGQTVTKEQLEQTVEHFAEEAKLEGKPFPAEGSAGFDQAQHRLLALLVYRAELADQADSLGLRVSDDAVEKRLEAGGSAEEGEDEAGKEFGRASVRAQLLYEAIYRKVTVAVSGNSPEASAKRNTLAANFVARMKQRYRANVRYEPGYRPGS